MTRAEHLSELLAAPIAERASAARALIESLDDGTPDADAEAAQSTELARRMRALEVGEGRFVDGAEARARVLARLSAIRGQ